MMLNGGELDGVRLLSRKTVELMTTDHAGDLREGAGFGLGFAITRNVTDREAAGSVGSYWWGGFFHTAFIVDPVEDMISIFMSQLRPNNPRDRAILRDLPFQAIID
jgi:CubicO group peptidase (beta-lactamase class C family)